MTTASHRLRWAGSPLLAAAAVSVATAVGISEGMFDPLSLGLVTAAVVAVAVGLAVTPQESAAPRATAWVLGAGIAVGLAFDAAFLPGILVDPARLGAFRPVLGALALLLASHLWPGCPAALDRLRLPAVLAIWIVLAAQVVLASPAPAIDVWRLQQAGALALSHGHDPYAVAYPNLYGPDTTLLAPEVLSPDRQYIVAYPYAPLTLLAGVPGALLGDVRWVHLLAVAAAAVLVWLVGRRSRVAELAATLLLVQPRTLMVVELGWTEPLVLAGACGLALAVDRPGTSRRWLLPGLAGGLLVATKQYAPLVALPFLGLTPAPTRLRALALAAGLAAATYLPFLLWNPGALWRGVVGFQLAQPFRPDSLSWLAAVVAAGGPQLPSWPAFLVAGAAVAWAAVRAASVRFALAGAALAWLVFVLLSKQAFANYHWLAAGLLAAAAACPPASHDP